MTSWIATWWHEQRKAFGNASVECVVDSSKQQTHGAGQHLITLEGAGLFMAVACSAAVCGG